MKLDAARISAAIAAAVHLESGLSEAEARDVAFHMTDWLEDLAAFHDFCADPEKRTTAEIARVLMDFLVHVPNHVAAAGKLLTGFGISDVFGAGGATDTDDEA